MTAPLLRKTRRSEAKLRALLDLLDAAGVAVAYDVDGHDFSTNEQARKQLEKLRVEPLRAAEAAEELQKAGIVPILAEAGLCVWEVPTTPIQRILSDTLSRREKEVARSLRKGKSATDIALVLGISPRTVEKHTQSIFGKCGVHSHREFMQRIAHGQI